MLSFSNLNAVQIAVSFLLPGYLFYLGRSKFASVPDRSAFERALSFLCASSVFVGFRIATRDWPSSFPTWMRDPYWLFLFPYICGFAWGASEQKQIGFKLLRLLGLQPRHHEPTAWDYVFRGLQQQFVLLTLKDGTTFAGLVSDKSFISSDTKERDLFIERIFEQPDDIREIWKPTSKSLYIAAGEIRCIEFFQGAQSDKGTKHHEPSHTRLSAAEATDRSCPSCGWG